jgi:NAD(P)-dependent dehydrogenase (short-subunit alcohol dehydrogenase family)
MTTSSVIIVTGAAGNVGREVLVALADAGMRVVAVDRDAAQLTAIVAGLKGASQHRVAGGVDLTAPAACHQVVAETLAATGRLDGVVHTVGGYKFAHAADGGAALWEFMFKINTLMTLNMFQAAIAPMQAAKRGSMVAIAAGAGLKATIGHGAYSASKSAVMRLVESFADELKGDGIRVNSVLPGTIDTPQNRAEMPTADYTRWVKPSQVASAIAFLISDAASGVTGAHLPVTGQG